MTPKLTFECVDSLRTIEISGREEMIARLISLLVICVFASGCATKTLKITTPNAKAPGKITGYIKIENIKDARNFMEAPIDPATPSIEGDKIKDKNITDKAIGRMRHGLFHYAMWNYSLEKKETIYSLCERIASNSFTNAGYQVVGKGDANYENATPISVEVAQFWAWLQPKFTGEMHFDGELKIISKDQSLEVSAKGADMFNVAVADADNWTKVVDHGVKKLQENLTTELKKKQK
jgi:hypothetical protein